MSKTEILFSRLISSIPSSSTPLRLTYSISWASHFKIISKGYSPYPVSLIKDSISSLEEQEAEVFVNIKNYDIESRFYQFENPDELSWYEINLYKDQLPVLFCFLNEDLPKFQVPAGYNLYRFVENDEPLKCLIFSEILEEPILVQSS